MKEFASGFGRDVEVVGAERSSRLCGNSGDGGGLEVSTVGDDGSAIGAETGSELCGSDKRGSVEGRMERLVRYRLSIEEVFDLPADELREGD